MQFPTIHRGNIWKNYLLSMSKKINKREKKRLVCKTSGLYHVFVFFHLLGQAIFLYDIWRHKYIDDLQVKWSSF